MGRFIAGACCVLVGLQVLVGVPLAVCIAFLSSVHGGAIGSIEIRVRSGRSANGSKEEADEVGPIASSQPQAQPVSSDLATIMASRGERGSLLHGTAFAGSSVEENSVIVEVLQRLSTEQQNDPVAMVLEASQNADEAVLRSLALGCAAEWSRLAAGQELAGNSGEANRYTELAQQCAKEARAGEIPAILSPTAN